MPVQSLRKAFRLIGSVPALWIPGILAGLLVGGDLLIEVYGDPFFTGKLWILELVIVPFLAAAILYTVRTGERAMKTLWTGGVRYYLRVLLPALIIGFAAIATAVLLAVPLSLIGAEPAAGLLMGMVLGVGIPFFFFTNFFDAAAVLEDRKVFESIRRSIEFVITSGWKSLQFYVINLLVAGAAGMFLLIIWTTILFDRVEVLSALNTTDLQSFDPAGFAKLLGPGGIWVTAILLAAGSAFLFTFAYTYKACFFREHEALTPVAQIIGEYDSKGRWYKY
jgi:hypothetical protein